MSAEGVRQPMKLVDLSGKRTERYKQICFLRLLNSEKAFFVFRIRKFIFEVCIWQTEREEKV